MSRVLQRRSILFVCTGNTCRSPMAEVLCRQLLAERLDCTADELPSRGYEVASAGILAMPGYPASPLAVELLPELKDHHSRMVNLETLAAATDVIAMTGAHAAVLQGRFPNVGPVPILLGGEADVPDPIGGSREDYLDCAARIREYLEPIITGWLKA